MLESMRQAALSVFKPFNSPSVRALNAASQPLLHLKPEFANHLFVVLSVPGSGDHGLEVLEIFTTWRMKRRSGQAPDQRFFLQKSMREAGFANIETG